MYKPGVRVSRKGGDNRKSPFYNTNILLNSQRDETLQ